VSLSGISDLTIRDHKFSGNSLRCKRDHLLYHGTILYGFPLENVARYLRTPPREPEYRAGRSHAEFLSNVPADPPTLQQSMRAAFDVGERMAQWPRDRVEQLVSQRYGQVMWHLER
jgi:lipoate-protein ligase A